MSNLFNTTETIENYDRTVRAVFTWVQPVEIRNLILKTHDLQIETAKYINTSLTKTMTSMVPTTK
jgi:hypothetical protein